MELKDKNYIFDLDGTLFRFHDEVRYIERMFEEGFFKGLKPFEELVRAVNELLAEGYNVYTLSAVVDSPFCVKEKISALQRACPQLKVQNVLFSKMGENKANVFCQAVGKAALDNDDVLYDDYNKNLVEWQNNGGKSVKVVNNINNKGLGAWGGDKGNLWQGETVDNMHPDVKNKILNTAADDFVFFVSDDGLQVLKENHIPFSMGSGKLRGKTVCAVDKSLRDTTLKALSALDAESYIFENFEAKKMSEIKRLTTNTPLAVL